MTSELTEHIDEENGSHGSVESQKTIAETFVEADIAENRDTWVRTSELEERVGDDIDHDVRLCLEHLEEAGVVVRKASGNRTFVRHERTEKNIFGNPKEDARFRGLLTTEIDRLLDDLEPSSHAGGSKPEKEDEEGEEGSETGSEPTRRAVVADALSNKGSIDVAPSASEVASVFDEDEDDVDRMDRLDTAVQAIQDHDSVEKTGEYEPMGWRNAATKWAMAETWYRRATHHSLSDFDVTGSSAPSPD